jgi:hypothetical protein
MRKTKLIPLRSSNHLLYIVIRGGKKKRGKTPFPLRSSNHLLYIVIRGGKKKRGKTPLCLCFPLEIPLG